ncbi:UBP1-associated protein 2A-like [Ipomoea triloba]|uniref:UBP1-associated protein 2A-like n=1 Tax=Ipomoea triloba TaxID=35885 RepID=UPI00125E20E6|nr:UBP1-associated protein 2A-like [Ipomoea triloba]XP_031114385.1 UBP1-associated protein 2A-like [Ipomoea triloba]XP_031114386.1 UBP1-associated protein 2A-like [Ipomoea triloba]XP_031114387.1 UBP1-associated protein 2A-like [Ipomoea triloba]
MAKKRKSRASYQPEIEPEPTQIQEPEQPQPEPDPQLEAPNEEPEQEVEEEVEEEEVEEVEEEEVEEADPEEEEEEEEEGEEEEKPESMEADVSKSDANPSNDAVSTGKANGEEKKAEVEEFDDEPLEKVLEPFSKEQLQVIIQEAVTKHPDFMENIRNWADKDPAHRKIFVHGLGWDTTTETLTNVFGKYGEIEDCKAVTDKVSGKSKGYAFILFKHRSGARKALKEPQKKIGNRITSCQLASAGPVPAPPPNPPPVSEYTQRKIFVSNVSADLDPKKLLEFFSKYGEIEEGPLGLDKHTGKPKGFCLFVYRSVESAKKVLEEPHKIFEGHTLNCQKAIDGPKQNKNYSQQQQHQPHYPQHQQHHYYQHTAKKGKYSSGGGGGSGATSAGHLMAPAAGPGAVGFNPAVAPVLGQALTALLTTQGAGLGIGNLLGGLPVNPHGVPPVVNNAPGYGAQSAPGGYGGHPGMQGGYQNPAMGQGGVRPQGGAPWRGH